MWAIKANHHEYGEDQLLGWEWFKEFTVPKSRRGYAGIALFPTRGQVRKHLKRVRKAAFPNATVVRLLIQEVGV
jgi:hypothetical protein